MSTSSLSPQDLQELRELASRWGKIVARRACGDAGPGLDLDFAAMEQIAEAAARGLSEGTLATLLEQQAQTLAADYPCPDCGRRCPVGREPRSLVCRAGPITYREPVCHCPACRRDFFPSAADLAPRRP